MKLFTPIIAKALALTGFSAFSMFAIAPAHAVVINFESLARPDAGVTEFGPTYTESGFTITSSPGFFSYDPSRSYSVLGTSSPSFAGSTTLYNTYSFSASTLSQVGGGAFSISSIDLANITSDGVFPNQVIFTGNLAGGGTVTQTFIKNL
jgi:hypothetical protein